ncbi:MAG: 4Fe-4S dicluster domain-containing protein [Methanomassiliicoccales archaeon]|nr:4Fe-4S dicluster domain-containing protein [Methanomassiliicoccales archaeon]
MKVSIIDSALPDIIRKYLPNVDVWKCHQCGQCSSVCPSFRYGGIRTREVIERASIGALDPSKDPSVWLCMMCQGCTERCQLGVEPAMVITLIRNMAAESGNLPDHFAEEARLFIDTGLSFPKTGLTKKIRKEMGLDDIEVKSSTLEDLRTIIERTRLGRIKLER